VLQTAWIEQTTAAVRNDLANLCDRSGMTVVLIQTCTIAALQCQPAFGASCQGACSIFVFAEVLKHQMLPSDSTCLKSMLEV